VQESKRDAWITDLANSQVPLSKLANSPIPHPFKGHDLLDMLYKNSVPIDRALWYVRVLGAHETVCEYMFIIFIALR
jgi:mediator of RNA polymerase II transcription subunit 12